jgi:hypothetical protein
VVVLGFIAAAEDMNEADGEGRTPILYTSHYGLRGSTDRSLKGGLPRGVAGQSRSGGELEIDHLSFIYTF